MSLIVSTSLFKDIFTSGSPATISYSTFATWYKNSSHMSDSATDCPSEKTFWILMNEFMDCHVAFKSNDDFKNHLAIKLYTYYKEFEATTRAIDDIMALTDSQLELGESAITNIANIPETVASTDAKNVDYITQQQKLLNQRGALEIKLIQLKNKRAYTVDKFLAKFRPLFIRILSSSYTAVIAEDVDG